MSTYSSLLYHVVFSTASRRPSLVGPWLRDLHDYAGGIVRSDGGRLLAIGGVADHIHLLICLGTAVALSDVMRAVKARTSAWIKTHGGPNDFAWQEGYGAFTVSKSHTNTIIRYIHRQPEHHATQSSLDELVALLDRHDISYDPQYLQ